MAIDPRAVFDRIGSAVEQRWRESNYDERVFPALAAEILVAERADRQLTAEDLLRWVLTTDRLPSQFDPSSRFGQPPLTMVRAPRFLIDALFWMEGTTDIHQHGFCGAFQVLAGSSVHSQYRFTLEDRVSSAMLLGDIRFERFEILTVGDIRTIGAGADLIHALFHLERPSVTIVIRTYKDAEGGPQYLFHPPSVAVDPFFDDPLLHRRIEALDVLAELDPARYEAAVREAIASADLYSVFRIAKHYLPRAGTFDRVRELLEAARPRHGARIDRLPPAFEAMARIASIAEKRRLMKGPDHRFFLALLMNLPARAAIVDAVTARYPGDDPYALIARWIDDLATALAGDTAQRDHTATVVAHLVRGFTGEALIAELKQEFDDDDVEALREQIDTIEQSLRAAPLLRPLFC